MPKKDIRELVSMEEILSNAFVAFMIYLERIDKKLGDKSLDTNAVIEAVIDKINNNDAYSFVYEDLISDLKEKCGVSQCSSVISGEVFGEGNHDYDSIIGKFARYAKNKRDLEVTKDEKPDVNQLLEKLTACIEDALLSGTYHLFYLERLGNSIDFGEMNQGIRTKILTLPVLHMNYFKTIYEYISVKFAEKFEFGAKHTFGLGWSLLPSIGENVMIDIDSHDPHDRSWFYQETTKNNKIKSEKNKNLK